MSKISLPLHYPKYFGVDLGVGPFKLYPIEWTPMHCIKYTPFQGQIICGKSHLVDTTYYDDHENGQHLNGVNIFIIVY